MVGSLVKESHMPCGQLKKFLVGICVNGEEDFYYDLFSEEETESVGDGRRPKWIA